MTFEQWWEKEGQFHRAGGGEYEKTFAFHAWAASKIEERNACISAAEGCATQFDGDIPQPGDKDFRRGGLAAANAIRMRSNAK